MAFFTTRVVLHQASYEDYEKLHKEMETERFTRAVIGDDGKTYLLPDAEYRSHSTTLDAPGVRLLASNAAARTGKAYAILVTMSDQCAWLGLQEIK